MNEIDIYILSIIGKLNNGNPVGIPSIDLRLTQKYPEVIQEGRLRMHINELYKNNLISKIDDLTVQITPKGREFLNNT